MMTTSQWFLTDGGGLAMQPVAPKPDELRPYQREAVDAIRSELAEHRSTLCVMPTGVGKTIVFVDVARQTQGRVLVLAHRAELIAQASAQIQRWTGETVGVEKAARYANGERIVVGSVQSFNPKRLARYSQDHFALVIVDESHHASAKSYRAVLDHFASAKILGVTATPKRTDGAALGKVFESIAYEYPIVSAIADGWLVDVISRRVPIEAWRLDEVGTSHGDFAQGELDAVVAGDPVIQSIATSLFAHARDRTTLAFLPGVASVHRLAALLNSCEAGVARAIDGSTPSDVRKQTIADHQAGLFPFLCNCLVFTEGYDSPEVDCIAIARPTKSVSLYRQMLGRGLRPAGGKEHCLVLDFVDSSSLDWRIIGPEDALAGAGQAPAAAGLKRRAADDPISIRGQLVAEAGRIAERLAKETQRLLDAQQAPAEPVPGRPPWWTVPTQKQLDFLEGVFGMSGAGMTRQQISKLLDRLVKLRNRAPATSKQKAVLRQFRLPTKNVTRSDASDTIDNLAANGWNHY